MPFDARGLTPLIAADSFTLWHYDTGDSRAAVLAPGYFGTASERLQQGHLLIVRAADAMALVPVQAAAAVGNGLVLDSSLAPLRETRAIALRFGVAMRAGTSARAAYLDDLPSSVAAGGTLSLGATATGVSRLVFTVINASGAIASGPVAATVSGGRATASLAAPAAGQGYRARVVDADDATVTALSDVFAVSAASASGALATESGGGLLTEGGDRLAA